jgi:hypothetical protein
VVIGHLSFFILGDSGGRYKKTPFKPFAAMTNGKLWQMTNGK